MPFSLLLLLLSVFDIAVFDGCAAAHDA